MHKVIPMGMGLDRHTGIMAVDPLTMYDMRNVRPLVGKLQARRGVLVQSELPAQGGQPCTSVRLLQSVRSQSEGIAVGYYHGNREVHVYRIAGDGTAPAHIAKWFDLPATAATPPIFTGAESYGKAFLAHDEARQSLRANTQLYDASKGTLADLEANLDGKGDAPIRFRGVDTWSDYLLGWGFASPSDIRPEFLRVSQPGEPDLFDPEHYFIVGDRGSPVHTVKHASANTSSSLVALKPTGSFRIIGSSRLDFGIMPSYALIGCLSSRLAVSVRDTVYAWGFDGPWSATYQQLLDLEEPLAIDNPFPADLPAAGPAREAFALYVPGEKVIEWHFGDRIYVLSLADGGLRWSLRERPGARAASGALMFSAAFGEALADGSGVAPTGGPTVAAVTSAGGSATVTWANNSQDGTELLEVWVAQTTNVRGTQKIITGEVFTNPAYQRQLPDRRVTAASEETTDISGLSIGQGYSVAVRYRRGGRYSPGYESDDPNEWPAASRMAFTASPAAPTLDSVRFLRTSSYETVMRVSFTPAVGNEEFEHVVYRAGVKIGTAPVGTTTYDDTSAAAGANHAYTVRTIAHGALSDPSNEVSARSSPDAPANVVYRRFSGDCPGTDVTYAVQWATRPEYGTEVRVAAGTPSTAPSGARSLRVCAPVANPVIEARHFTEEFGTRDYSEWVQAAAGSLVGGLPVINSFTASHSRIERAPNDPIFPVQLRWDVDDFTSLSIDRGVGDVTDLPFAEVIVGDSTTYTLTATNGLGSNTKTVRIEIVRIR